jgi:hypothetical protein
MLLACEVFWRPILNLFATAHVSQLQRSISVEIPLLRRYSFPDMYVFSISPHTVQTKEESAPCVDRHTDDPSLGCFAAASVNVLLETFHATEKGKASQAFHKARQHSFDGDLVTHLTDSTAACQRIRY